MSDRLKVAQTIYAEGNTSCGGTWESCQACRHNCIAIAAAVMEKIGELGYRRIDQPEKGNHVSDETGKEPGPVQEPETTVREEYEYGRLWPDGTFNRIGWNSEVMARDDFMEKGYELKKVPEALRPVFGRRRIITTTQTFAAEPTPEES